MSNQS